MLIDLDGPTIVRSFKQDLSSFTFIPQPDIGDISTQLDKLAGLTVRKGKKSHIHIHLKLTHPYGFGIILLIVL